MRKSNKQGSEPKAKPGGQLVGRSLDPIVRHAESPIIGRWFRHGRRWWNPTHKVVRVENRRVFSEGEQGNVGTCYPVWLWKRKYYSLSNSSLEQKEHRK